LLEIFVTIHIFLRKQKSI